MEMIHCNITRSLSEREKLFGSVRMRIGCFSHVASQIFLSSLHPSKYSCLRQNLLHYTCMAHLHAWTNTHMHLVCCFSMFTGMINCACVYFRLLKHGDECFEPHACPCLWKGKEYYPGDRVSSPCHQWWDYINSHSVHSFLCVFTPVSLLYYIFTYYKKYYIKEDYVVIGFWYFIVLDYEYVENDA